MKWTVLEGITPFIMSHKRHLVWNVCCLLFSLFSDTVSCFSFVSLNRICTMCDDLLLIKFIQLLSTSNKVGVMLNWYGSEFYFPNISEKYSLHLQGRIINEAWYQQKQAAFTDFLLTIYLSLWNVGLFLNYRM